MPGIVFIGLFLISIASFSQVPLHNEVRHLYFEGWEGECGALQLSQKLKDLDLSSEMILMAYRGAARSTLANCVSSPWKKMEHFNAGKREIEIAVRELPDNLEVRVIRFTVQSNAPEFLGYNNIETDKQFILKSLNLQMNSPGHDDFLFTIIDYLLGSSKLTNDEKRDLNCLMIKK